MLDTESRTLDVGQGAAELASVNAGIVKRQPWQVTDTENLNPDPLPSRGLKVLGCT